MKPVLDPAVPGIAGLDAPRDERAHRTPELRELRYFHCVARTGSFGRAARELNVTQPSVTAQVRKLEEVLGARLLTRHGRGMTLTPAGACLMERLERIFGLLNAPLDSPASLPDPSKTAGDLTLALPPEAAPLLVPALLEACEARLRHVRLAIKVGVSASLEEWVLDRQVDLALLQDPPVLDELDVEPVLTERLGLVSDVRDTSLDRAGLNGAGLDRAGLNGAGLEGAGAIRLRSLAGMKLVLPHPRHWIRRLIEDAAFRRGIVLRQVLQADDVSLIKEMVRHGLGHALLPYSVVRAEATRGSLSFRPIEHEPLTTIHAIASHRDAALSPLVTGVRRILREVLADLAQSGHWAGAVVSPRSPGMPPDATLGLPPETMDAEMRRLRVG